MVLLTEKTPTLGIPSANEKTDSKHGICLNAYVLPIVCFILHPFLGVTPAHSPRLKSRDPKGRKCPQNAFLRLNSQITVTLLFGKNITKYFRSTT